MCLLMEDMQNVEFSTDWHEDASRRDFTINSIYSDIKMEIYMIHLMEKKI